ncbi:hypothetical protein LY76DRAFT_208470 [Colletotrichum caudatum]|nr:hypothetical protein LY76DRAFT_208470 [Colletotrichum caudatum]
MLSVCLVAPASRPSRRRNCNIYIFPIRLSCTAFSQGMHLLSSAAPTLLTLALCHISHGVLVPAWPEPDRRETHFRSRFLDTPCRSDAPWHLLHHCFIASSDRRVVDRLR